MGSCERAKWGRCGVAVVFTVALGACYTGSHDQGGAAEADAADEAGEGGEGDGGGELPPPDGLDETKGHTPIRRLTAAEYRNTVADLFGVEPPALAELPPDSDVGAFRTTAGQRVTLNDVDKYLDAASAIADRIVPNADALLDCGGQEETTCVEGFLAGEGTRIFRRPISDPERDHYLEIFAGARAERSFPESVGAMLESMLLAPQFLFLLEPRPDDAVEGDPFAVDAWTLASRMSYLLWDTLPDDELLGLAASGELLDGDTLEAQAERMLDHERARGPVRAFLTDWLELDRLDSLYVDPAAHPEFTPEVIAALAEETRRFTEDAYWRGEDTLASLLVSPARVRNAALGSFYGDGLGGDVLDVHEGTVNERSFGLLSQAGYLAAINRNPNAQPIHRGKFILEKLLCRKLLPPDSDTVPPLPEVEPGTTTRERIEQHTSAPECAACHASMNPLGFTLEHFDGQGQWRADEDGLPIDAAVELVGTDIEGPVDGALALSRRLAESEMVRDCAAALLWEFVFGRAPEPEDAPSLDPLLEEMRASGDLRALVLHAVRSPMFVYRVEPKE